MSKSNINTELFAERFSGLLSESSENTYTMADRLSLSPGTISRYQHGQIAPKLTAVNDIAELFHVNPDWLRGEENAPKAPPLSNLRSAYADKFVSFPVVGKIAAGYGSFAEPEDTGEVADIPKTFLKGRDPSEFFVLKVSGNSMYPLYIEGDLVLIRKQSTIARSGQVCAVLYDSDLATLKRVDCNRGKNRIRLTPINPNYPPEDIEGEALNRCKILGVPKMVLREISD